MVSRDPAEPNPEAHSIDDELLGLDRDDPETQAFAAHLNRMQRDAPSYTVEGYLDGVSDFADSANRAGGGRRLVAVLLVAALLAVAAYLIADATGFVLSTWF
ncbi:MAG TPA: hypothetical protein VFE65_06615 [Pseudonocardia sp.]|jgi:hypothetical protein|nr:hypothetical protein [Pseudonocardia sp.]